MITAYVSIGNSDDKLSQAEWAAFHARVHDQVSYYAGQVHGAWVSGSASAYQNACWCVEVDESAVPSLKSNLARLARMYRQESIAWATARTEFLPGLSSGATWELGSA